MRTTVATAVLALALVGGAAGRAGADDPPVGDVEVPGPAYEGHDATFTGTILVRCGTGVAASELVMAFEQDGTTTPERAATALPTCTGEWESLDYRSDEGFDPGPVTVHVRLVLVDASTGEAQGEVEVAESIYVRPAAKVRLPRTASLRPSGLLTFRAWIRCDDPWQNYATFMSAAQGSVAAEPRVVRDVPCDGAYRLRRVWLRPEEGDFTRGRARVSVEVVLVDADFDFGPEAQASRRVRVR
jgi:hypothetical protein